MHARYYSSATGRFMSADPSGLTYADPTNPQSLNLYSYGLNDPLINIDPSGLDPCAPNLPPSDVTDQSTPLVITQGNDASGNAIGTQTVCVTATVGPDPIPDVVVASANAIAPSQPNYPTNTTAGAPNSDPCANATLAAAGVNAQQQIGTAQGYIAAGQAGANTSPYANPIFSFFGGMFGYYEAVHTGGPNDVKNQSGPGFHNQVGVDAGNISFGITCPYGAGFCQFAAGAAQTLSGNPNFNGTIRTGFDTPSDNASIRQGQAMRAAGCHG